MAAINLRFLERLKSVLAKPGAFDKFLAESYAHKKAPAPELVSVIRAYRDTQRKRA